MLKKGTLRQLGVVSESVEDDPWKPPKPLSMPKLEPGVGTSPGPTGPPSSSEKRDPHNPKVRTGKQGTPGREFFGLLDFLRFLWTPDTQ